MISFEVFLTISSHTKVEYYIQHNTSNQGFSIHKLQVPNKVSTYHKSQIQTNQKLPIIENEVICLQKRKKQEPNGGKLNKHQGEGSEISTKGRGSKQ